ncbi:DUF2599 domain-containing protein [Williamsia sp. CHRR-6]|uniref:DUF2599 domain-containing protein n=1 Tax=Williamsia sp. CHRR-6 TaxID=2835871 RepID=UPI001BDA7FC5|nr:DUF2599 domain-containing protein [Williamsia sp. CHRR-6]MBT0566014.1 DUF2599 domain-containing protein [Williamsia sp. CHRR-6]
MSLLRKHIGVSVMLGSVLVATTACGDSPNSGAAAGPTATFVPDVVTAPPARPPFIDHVTWVTLASGRSLQVYPTPSGRRAAGADDDDRAWAEVVADDATADSPGMRAQFDCHWTFARLVAPDKPSWNLEPWRPVVSAEEMIATRCNPGGAEE